MNFGELKKRIKEKNFSLTYKEAIDLGEVIDVDYEWVEAMGSPPLLAFVVIHHYNLRMTVDN